MGKLRKTCRILTAVERGRGPAKGSAMHPDAWHSAPRERETAQLGSAGDERAYVRDAALRVTANEEI